MLPCYGKFTPGFVRIKFGMNPLILGASSFILGNQNASYPSGYF
jgi:hypothetical protein